MEIFIERHFETNMVKVFAKEERGNCDVFYSYGGEGLIQQTMDRSNPVALNIKPLLELPYNMVNSLISAFVNEGHKLNIRTENENHLKGKLEATEIHLADMREFSKKLLDNNILTRVDGF